MKNFWTYSSGRYKRVGALAAVLSISLLTACGGSDSGGDNGDAKVRVAIVQGFGTLPVHVAQTRGIFKKNGLDVKVTEGSDIAAWTAALGKQYDIVQETGPVYVSALAKNIKVTAISGLQLATDANPGAVLVTREPISGFKDLAGKKIGVNSLTGMSAQALKYVLDDADVKGYSLAQVDFGSASDQLKAKRVFGVVVPEPFFNDLKAQGYSVAQDVTVAAVEAVTNGAVKEVPSSIYAANADWANENAKIVAAWRKSIQESIDWITANEPKARDELAKWLNFPADVVANQQLPDLVVDVTVDQLQPFVTIMKASGALKSDVPNLSDAVWSK